MITVGSVIEDSYGNPAVVLKLDHLGKPTLIMQTIGSDSGRVTYALSPIREITGERADRAKERARVEWTRRGYRRSQFGIK